MLFRIWVVTQAMTDLVIAVAISWEFRKANPGSKETRRCASTVSVALWAQLT